MSNTILSELGLDWDEGLTIPVANAENKFLEDEVHVIFKLYSYGYERTYRGTIGSNNLALWLISELQAR